MTETSFQSQVSLPQKKILWNAKNTLVTMVITVIVFICIVYQLNPLFFFCFFFCHFYDSIQEISPENSHGARILNSLFRGISRGSSFLPSVDLHGCSVFNIKCTLAKYLYLCKKIHGPNDSQVDTFLKNVSTVGRAGSTTGFTY